MGCPRRCRGLPPCPASAAVARIVCSAALQGTRPSSHGPGAISAKLSLSASGTAARLISRSSRQNGFFPAKWRQASSTTLLASGTSKRRRSAAVARRIARAVKLVAIGQAERLDLCLDVVDFEDRGLRARPGARSCRNAGAARSARSWPAATAPCSRSCASSGIRPTARARTGCGGRAASRRKRCAR